MHREELTSKNMLASVARRLLSTPPPAAVRGLASAATVADVRYVLASTFPAASDPRALVLVLCASTEDIDPPRSFGSLCARSVSCTFLMTKQKQKVTIPGMVGWTLLETLQHHGIMTHVVGAEKPWDYNTFGEGPMHSQDHVVVAREYYDKTMPLGYQERNVLDTELVDGALTAT